MIWIVLAIVLVLAVLAAAAALVSRRRRSARLQQRFGPEYDRTVEARGDQREAEAELHERFTRRQELEIRALEPDARARYAERWERAQRHFVDQPTAAVAEADELVAEVMHERGYPVAEGFEQRAADVSVDHPEVVEHYRAAHGISQGATEGRAQTEDLRKAMVHFRALFDELLGAETHETNRS